MDSTWSAWSTNFQLELRGEFRQLVDAELLFDAADFLNHPFEAFRTKHFVFFFLEVFAQRVVFTLADDGMQRGKQDGVFPRLVGTIHADKHPEQTAHELAVIVLFE